MALLEYDFKVVGQGAINKAFASIERRAAQHAAKMDQTFGGRANRGRGSAMRPEKGAGLAAQARDGERVARQVANSKIREDRRVLSEQTKNARYLQQVRNKHYQQDERQRKRADIAAARSRSSTLGTMGRSVSGSLRTIGRVGASALALGGGFAVAGAVSQQMRETAMASKLANQAGDPTQKKAILKEAQSVRGMSGEDTLSAMTGFVGLTGNVDAARGAIQGLAKLSIATATDFGEMGQAAGQAFNVIKDEIKDPKKQLEAINDVMITLAAQGNMGAVEIRDMATELAALGAGARKYSGSKVELLKKMGSMAQAAVGRGGAQNAAEASTAVVRFGEDLTKKPAQKALSALGVNIFADKAKTQLRSPDEIMPEIMGKTGGDLTKLQDIFNAQSIKAFGGFSSNYLDAESANAALPAGQRQAKGEAGKAAMRAEFDRFGNATIANDALNTGYNSRLGDADLQFTDAMKNFNAAVGSQLLPAITKLIPKIAEMTPIISSVIEKLIWMVDQFGVSGTLLAGIGAKMAADVASAKIGELIMKGISSNPIGAVALTAGAVTLALGKAVIDDAATSSAEANNAAVSLTGRSSSRDAAVSSAMGSGDLTGAAGMLEQQIAETRKAVEASKQDLYGGTIQKLFEGIATTIGGEGGDAVEKRQQDAADRSAKNEIELAKQTALLAEIKTAIASAGGVNRTGTPTVPTVK